MAQDVAKTIFRHAERWKEPFNLESSTPWFVIRRWRSFEHCLCLALLDLLRAIVDESTRFLVVVDTKSLGTPVPIDQHQQHVPVAWGFQGYHLGGDGQ
jgi:hypothetical protein